MANVSGGSDYVRVQVLTNAGGLDRSKQISLVSRLPASIVGAPGNPPPPERTWVLLTEAPQGGWGRQVRARPPAPGKLGEAEQYTTLLHHVWTLPRTKPAGKKRVWDETKWVLRYLVIDVWVRASGQVLEPLAKTIVCMSFSDRTPEETSSSAVCGSCGVYRRHGTGALTGGGCDTLHGSMPHVAHREDARLR